MEDLFSAGISRVENANHAADVRSQMTSDGKFNMSDLYLYDPGAESQKNNPNTCRN